MASIDRVLRRLSRTVSSPQPARSVTRRRTGVVASVTPGAAMDGAAAVTVNVNGSVVAAAYLDSYVSPAVDDLVEVVLSDGSPIIHGRIVGRPTI